MRQARKEEEEKAKLVKENPLSPPATIAINNDERTLDNYDNQHDTA